MRKVADFIVEKRTLLLVLILIIAAVSTVVMMFVPVNADMTKYLPDDSGMKIGLDIMEEEFPSVEDNYTIRVMFDDLNDTQKVEIKDRLEAIEYVKSVDHDPNDASFKKENHTLYVINTAYDYGTKEEAAIEKALKNDFSDYTMSYKNDDIGMQEIPLWIIALAIAILVIILLIMCNSWVEPFLFLASVGVAVLINMGTNIVMGEISEITFAIAAILQLVLSMDYSIILINRYRQELATTDDKVEAMKRAIANGFSSIASSSVTTIVGLLVLVFMSFKIGLDFGVVLAKGVFLSMVCTFTVLPSLILLFDKLINKTAKRALEIKSGALARFSYRFRYVITAAFVLLFAGMFMMKGNTDIAYTLDPNDPIADIFPATNSIVLIYENRDDEAVARIAEGLEGHERVDDISSYSTTLGRELTAAELTSQLADFGSDADMLDPSLLGIIYYDYYSGGAEIRVTAGDFIDFIANNVMTNDAFSEYLDEGLRENINTMQQFSDPANLTRDMSAAELAGFFGLAEDDVRGLLLLYHMQNGDIDTGEMTLSEFTDFVATVLASYPDYADMLTPDMLSQMETLSSFTDADQVTRARSAGDIAALLGMEEGSAAMLFAYYYAMSPDYEPGDMTLPQFVGFMANDVAANPIFAGQIDADTLAQVQLLAGFTDKDAIQAELTADQLAGALDIDTATVKQLFMLSFGADIADKTMSIQAMVELVLETVSENPQLAAFIDEATLVQLNFMKILMDATVAETAYSYAQLAELLSMDAPTSRMLYTFYEAGYGDTGAWALSISDIVSFLTNNSSSLSGMLDEELVGRLGTVQSLLDGAVSGARYTSAQMAELLGMSAEQLDGLYLLNMSERGDAGELGISVERFIGFVAGDLMTGGEYNDQFDATTAAQLHTAEALVGAVISGRSYTASELTELLGGMSDELDGDVMELLTLYYASVNNGDPEWKLSIATLFDHLTGELLDDPRFERFLDADLRADIRDMGVTLDEGREQLRGPNHSRLILNTSLPAESGETTEFIDGLIGECEGAIAGDYYLVGNSVMNHEMMNTFDDEMNFITILTAIALFIVILVTFRSISIPVILVLVIQCGVYLTISIIGLQGYSIYYLALLIVQCILMGATIDYGILFTSYYREKRREMGVKDALAGAYNGAIHTILTSGSIMILVTGILGYCFENPTIGQICMTISQGTLCATVLILIFLPGILAACDRLVIGKKGVKDELSES